MIKVFHIISRFDMGGAEKVALNIASSKTDGYEYHIVEVIRGRSDYTHVFINEMRRRGITYHRSPIAAVKFHYVFERVAAALFPLWFVFILLRHKRAVIHAHTEVPDMAVCCLLKLFPWLKRRVKLVRTIHNTRLWSGLGGTGRTVERFMQANAVNVAISPNVAQCYTKAYGGETHIIYNGVPDVEQGSFNGIVPACKNVLFAGRFEEQKGVRHLVKLLKAIGDNPRYHFFIIGDGSLKPLIETELQGQDNITLLPPVYGLGAYLSNFNLLLMPSEFEGLSILSIEASLAGLPVACNRCAGLIDTLPEAWPLAVTDNNIDEWLHLFNDVIPTTDLARLGAEAQRFARSHFGVKRMQREYEGIYK